jgi:hypothetical protein
MSVYHILHPGRFMNNFVYIIVLSERLTLQGIALIIPEDSGTNYNP